MSNFEIHPTMKRKIIVDNEKKLRRMCQKLMKVKAFAFDTETNTLKVLSNNSKLNVVGISFSWGDFENYYIPLGHKRAEDYGRQLDRDLVVEYLQEVFDREDVEIVGARIKFDLHVLKRIGIEVKTKQFFDVQIACWLCDENNFKGLKESAMREMKIPATKFKEITETVPGQVKKQFGLKANNKAPFDLVLIDDGAEYAMADSFNTWKLYVGYVQLLVDEGMDEIYYEHYVPLIDICFRMEELGVEVDKDILNAMADEIKNDINDLKYEIYELAGVEFNPASDQQLQELLFGYRKPDKKDKNGKMVKANVNEHILKKSFNFQVIAKTKSGAPSTAGDTLNNLSLMNFKDKRKRQGVEVAKLLMDFAKLEKLDSAFIRGLIEKDKMYEDGRVHPNINIDGTDSGRFSYSEPNLQQLASAEDEDKYKIRSMFVGSIDHKTGKRKKVIAVDYNNLEMRLLCHFSGDKNLHEMFAKNLDTHGSTAVNMFELDCDANDAKKEYPALRQAAKTLNFLKIA